MNRKTVLLGVVGDSASGKTTLTKGIVNLLGAENVTAICSDDYHKYNRVQRAEKDITALHPDCNYVDIMEQHFTDLKQGRAILKPNYNHSTGDFDAPTYVKPTKFVIIEGLLGFHTRVMRDLFDVKVYLDPPEEVRVDWKLQRDTSKRGYTREEVIAALKSREDDTEAYIRPQKRYADITVSFYPQENKEDDRLNADIALSPSNPHPEFSQFIEDLAQNYRPQDGNPSMISLGLEKWNSRAVEVLKVSGALEADQTNELKEIFGKKLHQSNFDMNLGDVGVFQKGDDCFTSYPLAFVQMAISYFMVKAQ
jgi:phosphoribulokinase